MRYGATPTAVFGRVEPEEDASPPPPPASPGRWRRRGWIALGVVVAVVLGVLAWATAHNSSKPSVSKADVGKIVDNKVGTAVTNLKNLPPPGVGVFSAVRPQVVGIESAGGDKGKGTAPRSGGVINTQGPNPTAPPGRAGPA